MQPGQLSLVSPAALLGILVFAATSSATGPRCGISTAWLTEPAADTVLAEDTVYFAWDEGHAIVEYALAVAKDPLTLTRPSAQHGPGGDVFTLGPTNERSALVTGIPVDGRNVYIMLWSREGCSGSWMGERFVCVTEGFLPGDGNGDGRITLVDALFVLKMALRLQLPILPLADADGDGEIRVGDALCVLRAVVGLSSSRCG